MSRASNLAGFTTSISPPANLSVGIITASSVINVGTGLTLSSGGINITGVITATSFSGNGSGLTGVGLGTTGSINTSGIITASSFSGNGSGLTGVAATTLTIGAGTTALPSISPTGDSNTGIFFPSADTIAFAEGGAEAMRVDSSGRLLIGTSTARDKFFNAASGENPVVQFEGAGASAQGLYMLSLTANNTSASAGAGAHLFLARSGGGSVGSYSAVSDGHALGAISFQGADGTNFVEGASIKAFVDGTPGADDLPSRLVFFTTADGASSTTERMRISNDGTVLVNRTSNTSTASQLAVSYPGGTKFGLTLNDTDSVAALAIKFDRGGTQVGSITTNTGATSYNTSSDYRLKDNIVLLAGAVERIQQIPVYRFNFIADHDKTVDGFLAHEAAQVVPECVTGEKDAVDDDGNPVYQGIDQSKLVPLLTAALQEAIAEIASLKDRVAALEGE